MLSLVLFLMLQKFPLRFEGGHAQVDQNSHMTYIPVSQIRPFRFGVLQIEGDVLTKDVTLLCEAHHEETKAFIRNRDGSESQVSINLLIWKCDGNRSFQVLGVEDPEQ